MKNRLTLWRASLIISMSLITLVGCGNENEELSNASASTEIAQEVAENPNIEKSEDLKVEAEKETTEPIVEIAEEVAEPVRDLGGKVITLASNGEVVEPEIKANAREEALWEYRNEMMEKHNFKFEQIAAYKWNQGAEYLATGVMSEDPVGEIFFVFSTYVPSAVNNNLCYDLATLDSIDLDDPKWKDSVIDATTRGDSVYGINKSDFTTGGLYFNKRLFEEAGINPEDMYDWQKNGEWTWDKFIEVCELLTRDLDNDGIPDTYSISMEPAELLQQAMISNGARIVEIDENGKFYNGTKSPQAITAIEWVDQFYDLPYELNPSNYQGFQDLFKTGKVAMFRGNENEVTVFADMEDDFGFVKFPMGPDATQYASGTSASAWMIPITYSKEEAEDIAFALDIWTNEPPGYDGPDDWMSEEYPRFRDDRAVEETLAMTREQDGVIVFDYRSLVYGVSSSAISNPIYYNEKTVAEAIEAVAPIYDAAIAKANGE